MWCFAFARAGNANFPRNWTLNLPPTPGFARLAEKVTANPLRDWRTEALAREAGVSLRSLSRLFQADLNISPADFVERVRVDLARRRLLESDDSIETIARGCGFRSPRRM